MVTGAVRAGVDAWHAWLVAHACCGRASSSSSSSSSAATATATVVVRGAMVCAGVMMALAIGAVWARVETDAMALYVPRESAARRELDWFRDVFGDSRAQTFVVKAKDGAVLLSMEAFLEVHDFTSWLFDVDVDVEGVGELKLENFCYKVVDSAPHAPCFMISPLDCFAEGNVSVVGREKNADFGSYAARASYRDFDFARGAFNATYVKNSCQQWFNLPLPQKVLFGGLREEIGSGALCADAMRVAILTRDAKNLFNAGIQKSTFELELARKGDLIGCPASGPSLDDCSCVEDFNLFKVLDYGCVPEGDVPQPESCCNFMRDLRAHPCIGALWSSDSTLNALGNQVLTTCGLPVVRLESQCATLPDGLTTNASMTTFRVEDLSSTLPMKNVFTCGSMLRSLQTLCPLIASGNYSGAGACCGAVEDFTKSKCHCGEMHCGPMPCGDLFAIDGVKQIVQFCTLSGFETPNFDTCATGDTSNTTDSFGAMRGSVAEDADVERELKFVPKHHKYALASIEDAERVLLDWESAWLGRIEDKLATYRHIDIVYMAERSAEDVIAKASRGAFGLIAVGYVIVAAYIVTYFAVSSSRGGSVGARAALEAVCAVALCTFGALGAASLLRFVFPSVTFNAVTLQVLPFLSLGLGVNDFFVLASHASSAAIEHEHGEDDVERALYEMMRRGGYSVTLSSAMNFAAFLIGIVCPVPLVRNFTIQGACAVVANYVGAAFIFTDIIYRDLSRRARRQRHGSALSTSPSSTSMSRASSSFALLATAAKASVVRIGISAISPRRSVILRVTAILGILAFAILAMIGIPRVRLGLELSDVVPQDSYVYDFVLDVERHFGTTPVWVVIKNFDFATHAEAMRRLEFDFLKVRNVDSEYESTNFLRYYTEHTEAQVAAGKSCSLDETFWYYDPLRMRPSADVCANDAADENQTFICMFKCLSYEPQARPTSPLNTNSSILDMRCVFGNDGERSTCHCPHRALYTPAAFTRNFNEFLNGGERGEISRAFTRLKTDTSNGTAVSSARMLFYVEDAFTLEDKLAHVREARWTLAKSDVVSKHGGSAFVFDYALYALNEQYMDIRRNLLVAISIAIGVATCVMYVMLNDAVTTLVCAAVLTLIQLELYGALYWLDMKLNPVSFINLVTTTGVSVEIVAHMARAYSVATEPDRTSRALRAFTTMAPALANGALTTFLGISPVAFSNYAYFVKYFWLQWCVMLAVSLAHGIVLAPILLSLIGGGETGVEKDAIATIDCDGVDTHDHP